MGVTVNLLYLGYTAAPPDLHMKCDSKRDNMPWICPVARYRTREEGGGGGKVLMHGRCLGENKLIGGF